MSDSAKTKIRLACSLGDPNSISPEVLLKALAAEGALDLFSPIIYASWRLMGYYRKLYDLQGISLHQVRKPGDLKDGMINVVNVWEDDVRVEPGTPNKEVSLFALKSLQASCEALDNNEADALVTMPIDKSLIAAHLEGFTGHTGFLGQRYQANPLMILCNQNLRVALVTGHIPLKQVSQALSIDGIMQKILDFHRALRENFGLHRPRIAVLGLNPHNGEGGLLGNEEIDIIKPAVERSFAQGLLAFGPFSPDGFFGSGAQNDFDGVLAMYHDQGLIPFKMSGFEQGVNFTAGLPIVRTSPDHGTAFSVAGKGEASFSSTLQAMYLACDTLRNRGIYAEISENPLPFNKRGNRDS